MFEFSGPLGRSSVSGDRLDESIVDGYDDDDGDDLVWIIMYYLPAFPSFSPSPQGILCSSSLCV